MHAGMYWVDSAIEIPFETRLEKAAGYYQLKYGRFPTLCLVHPSMLAAGEFRLGKLTVRPYAPIVRGHLWIGVEDAVPVKARNRLRQRTPAPAPSRE